MRSNLYLQSPQQITESGFNDPVEKALKTLLEKGKRTFSNISKISITKKYPIANIENCNLNISLNLERSKQSDLVSATLF